MAGSVVLYLMPTECEQIWKNSYTLYTFINTHTHVHSPHITFLYRKSSDIILGDNVGYYVCLFGFYIKVAHLGHILMSYMGKAVNPQSLRSIPYFLDK